jgi:hypothetical protein
MRKWFLRITVTFHKDGTIEVLFEWICSNPGTGLELATPLYRGQLLSKRHNGASIKFKQCVVKHQLVRLNFFAWPTTLVLFPHSGNLAVVIRPSLSCYLPSFLP